MINPDAKSSIQGDMKDALYIVLAFPAALYTTLYSGICPTFVFLGLVVPAFCGLDASENTSVGMQTLAVTSILDLVWIVATAFWSQRIIGVFRDPQASSWPLKIIFFCIAVLPVLSLICSYALSMYPYIF